MRYILAILLVALTEILLAAQPYKRTLKLMGSRFDITVVANNEAEANSFIDLAVAEITRIEKVISSWDPNSETSAVNAAAGKKPVKVSPELFMLIKRAIGISKLTDGAFDITYASMDRIWKFDGSMKEMPSAESIRASVTKVGYQNIVLDEANSSVFLKKKA